MIRSGALLVSGDLEIGGPTLAAGFIRRGLVDEYALVVHPVILGAGTPLFPDLERPAGLRLLETRTFSSGAVYLGFATRRPRDVEDGVEREADASDRRPERTMTVMTYDELLALARRLEDHPIPTVTGRLFTVGVYLDSLVFTPSSSGLGQSDGRKAAERFLGRYNKTGSLRPGDYADITRNSSYLVGLLRAAGLR